MEARPSLAARVALAEQAEVLREALGLMPGTPAANVVMVAARRLRIEDRVKGMSVAKKAATCEYVLSCNPNALLEAAAALEEAHEAAAVAALSEAARWRPCSAAHALEDSMEEAVVAPAAAPAATDDAVAEEYPRSGSNAGQAARRADLNL
jgi:hypothetical protein